MQATSCFDLKLEMVQCCSGSELVKTNQDSLLAIAKFIGEVRSRKIPNYRNGGTARPGRAILQKEGVWDANLLTNSADKEAYEKAVENNQLDMRMNSLQLSLFKADRIATLYLLQYCSEVSLSDPQRNELMLRIAAAAHFNDEEQKKMK